LRRGSKERLPLRLDPAENLGDGLPRLGGYALSLVVWDTSGMSATDPARNQRAVAIDVMEAEDCDRLAFRAERVNEIAGGSGCESFARRESKSHLGGTKCCPATTGYQWRPSSMLRW
jgi:hypothetical protein